MLKKLSSLVLLTMEDSNVHYKPNTCKNKANYVKVKSKTAKTKKIYTIYCLKKIDYKTFYKHELHTFI